MSTTEDAFQVALNKFKRRLKPHELDSFKHTTALDVKKEIAQMQHQQEEKRELRNLARLASFLEAMEQFGKVVDVFANASEYVAFIWGPLKFLLQTAGTFLHSFNLILDAYQKIGSTMPLLAQYAALFRQRPPMQKILVGVYEDILKFHQAALRYLDGKIWKKVFRSVWADYKTRFEGILDSLKWKRDLLESQAQLHHFSDSQHFSFDMLRKLSELEQSQRTMNNRLQEEFGMRSQAKKQTILTWLAGSFSEKEHDDLQKIQHPQTGNWLLQDERVLRWLQDDHPRHTTLWIHGVPGAGKTVLASNLIEACKTIDESATAFFYCNLNADNNKGLSVLKGLLSGFIQQIEDLVPYFYDQISRSSPILESESSARQLLELICMNGRRLYLLIDGLDECSPPERKTILSILKSCLKHAEDSKPSSLRIAIISQQDDSIRRELIDPEILEITAANVAPDIRTFVRSRVTKIQQKFQIGEAEAESLVDRVCLPAKDQFLYAKLVIENLLEQKTLRGYRNELKENVFPKKLAEAYERIIARIRSLTQDSEVDWAMAKRLLGWLVCAARPLKWHEIQAALSIDFDAQMIDFEENMLRCHIQELCSSLVKVSADRVTLVHSTARDYIGASRYIRLPLVECEMATMCLRYLSFSCFTDPWFDIRGPARRGDFAFQDYAIAKWSSHFLRLMKTAGSISDLMVSNNAEQNAATSVSGLEEALDDFGHEFSTALDGTKPEGTDLEPPPLPVEVDRLFEQSCPQRQVELMETTRKIWSHVQLNLRQNAVSRTRVSLIPLEDALQRSRYWIEEQSNSRGLSDSDRQQLDLYYGERRFKCSKVSCYFFHEGFLHPKERDKHVNKHDRPWFCELCQSDEFEFGFGSKKDLENHMQLSHPGSEEPEDKKNRFPVETNTPAKPGKWECPICHKCLARRNILHSHIDAHNGIKTHACTHCGKAFTRMNDRTRHERIHDKR